MDGEGENPWYILSDSFLNQHAVTDITNHADRHYKLTSKVVARFQLRLCEQASNSRGQFAHTLSRPQFQDLP